MTDSVTPQLILLSTLHQYHAQTPAYSYVILHQTLEQLAPQVLCLELGAEDLPIPQKTQKLEYEQVILPYARQHPQVPLVCLEPDGMKRSRLHNRTRKHLENIQKEQADKLKILSDYTQTTYNYLFKYWDSVIKINDHLTDALLEVKHNFQNSLMGEQEQKIWEDWNNHFLQAILKTCTAHPGKRILVTVGVERHYWLANALRQQGIPPLDLATLLQS